MPKPLATRRYFVTCAAGTEVALRDELREIGLHRVRADRGGARFEGTTEDAWRACLWTRIGVRVMQPLAEFAAPTADALYEGTRGIDWSEHLTPRTTLAVSAVCRDSALGHTMFVAQRTKDAIVDQIRDAVGTRPSVDRHDPDVAVFVRIAADRASVHLDLAGRSLHERGWRRRSTTAPLKETLAAAVVRLSGWDRDSPFVDPLCGTGTLAIEADHLSRRIAPGLGRDRFGFERWASFGEASAAAMGRLRDEARSAALAHGPEVLAFDADPRAVEAARACVRVARSRARVDRAQIRDLRGTTPPGTVCANPPYGERMPTTAGMRRDIDEALGRLPRGHRVALLVPAGSALRAARRAERVSLYNGALDCELLRWRT